MSKNQKCSLFCVVHGVVEHRSKMEAQRGPSSSRNKKVLFVAMAPVVSRFLTDIKTRFILLLITYST